MFKNVFDKMYKVKVYKVKMKFMKCVLLGKKMFFLLLLFTMSVKS